MIPDSVGRQIPLPFGSIYIKDGILCFDAMMFGGISVTGNKIPSLPVGWDTNQDGDAFEIVNSAGKPVYQIQFISSSLVRLDGAFVADSEDANEVFSSDINGRWGHAHAAVFGIIYDANGDECRSPVLTDALFKYPSRSLKGVASGISRGTTRKAEEIRRVLLASKIGNFYSALDRLFLEPPSFKLIIRHKDTKLATNEAYNIYQSLTVRGWKIGIHAGIENAIPGEFITIAATADNFRDGAVASRLVDVFSSVNNTARLVSPDIAPDVIELIINRPY